MTKRIFRGFLGIAIGTLLLTLVLVIGVLYGYFSNMSNKQLRTELKLAAEGVNHEGEDYLKTLSLKNLRLTLIEEDGKVVYDTHYKDVEDLENHGDREEVKEAKENGAGSSTRYSSTYLETLVYQAVRLDNHQILRAAISRYTVVTFVLAMLQPICLIIIIAILLSIFVAKRVTKRILGPLERLDLQKPLQNVEAYEELVPLLRRIDNQNLQIEKRNQKLQEKQEEMNTMFESMKEGLIMLDNKERIVHSNEAAKQILQLREACEGKTLLELERNITLQEMVKESKGKQTVKRRMVIDGNIYRASVSVIQKDQELLGFVLVFLDITQKEQVTELRKEFTANVSHELRTPLQTILGYSELLKNHLVKPEDENSFIEKIHQEAGQMIQLIEDIIELSHLDEGKGREEKEQVDIYSLSQEVVNKLQGQAQAKQVSLSCIGETAKVKGYPRLLKEIVTNLVDNAIKYNHAGGEVKVIVENGKDSVYLQVKDTGMGIAREDQMRIFERFYRGDKSRSKEIKGTGLGLSIVKHGVELHHGMIEVISKKDKGTTMKVSFPK
ncbi:MAG TPA: ATP-binding protein [Lachnospiraceae bacterium]